MAVLEKRNADRARHVALIEGVKLGAAADLLCELGWHRWCDDRADVSHSNPKLAGELREIRKNRDAALRRTLAAKRSVAA
jgi:hypothetical protein